MPNISVVEQRSEKLDVAPEVAALTHPCSIVAAVPPLSLVYSTQTICTMVPAVTVIVQAPTIDPPAVLVLVPVLVLVDFVLSLLPHAPSARPRPTINTRTAKIWLMVVTFLLPRLCMLAGARSLHTINQERFRSSP